MVISNNTNYNKIENKILINIDKIRGYALL